LGFACLGCWLGTHPIEMLRVFPLDLERIGALLHKRKYDAAWDETPT
jgi:hypothetical protein